MSVYDTQNETTRDGALQAAADAVRAGRLIVLPTDTVYGIGADAFTPEAVQDLLSAKGRGRDVPPPVLVGDPALGLRVVPADEFVESWNGVYFVIDRPATPGNQAFNLPGHWASFNRAPMGSRFSDPVSQQALALTAPFYRDF